MATVAITPKRLVLNTFSENLEQTTNGTANNLVPTTAADGWVIAAGALDDAVLILKLYAGAAETFTFKAGARPPSQRAGLGDLAITMASGQARYICIEASRFMAADGTITVTATSTLSRLTALAVSYQDQRP